MSAQKNSATILYVDDDAVAREVFHQTFGEQYNVRVAEDGEAALELLERYPVAAIVTDQRMPGMTGNELLELVKQRFGNVVRIVVTAHNDMDLILQAVNTGLVARYLVKPWKVKELEETLRWALEMHASVERDPAMRVRMLNVERLATLGGLLAGVLHDIGGPISYLSANTERLRQFEPLMGNLKKLVDANQESLPKKQRVMLGQMFEEYEELVEDMRFGCEHLVEICRGLRPLVRHDAPSGQGRADADKAVNYVTSVARHRARELVGGGVVEIHLDAPADLPVVATAFPALVQVLTNLLDNAIEAIERAGGQGSVQLMVTVEAERLLFKVIDDAGGIPASLLPRVTDPFFTTRAAGTGLGLAQCRRLVETAGGKFEITSEEGKGTTASFSFARV